MAKSAKRYIGIILFGSAPLAEILGERLIDLGAVGVEERARGAAGELDLDTDYGIEEFGVEPPAETAVERELLAAFPESEWADIQPALDTLLLSMRDFIPDLSYTSERLPDFDSVARWRKDLKNFILSPEIGVAPLRTMIPKDKRIWLVVPPRMAFGTGEHETTRMASKLTAEWTNPGDRVLDAGCGTGILGLVALKKGASYCLGIDIEADAVRETRQNVARNHLQGKMSAKEGSILTYPFKSDEKYDLILANIHLNVLKAWWPQIPALLNPSGRVIVTGLLVGQGKKLGRALGSATIRRQSHSWIVLGFQPEI